MGANCEVEYTVFSAVENRNELYNALNYRF